MDREEAQPIKRSRLQSQREKSAPSTIVWRAQSAEVRRAETRGREAARGGEDRLECDPRKLM